ncbi:aldo/keto reductase [uncultured Clostridium sp.]|jgi:aryl-alcohol dehydrogenase-like predicted oxidoreductase|uniref:aldo/keto reductase n=1 Tax=uncultured Clostridium sp. TaxID=59620 RepID=UPI002603FEBC|nr:aldo/keto reductase [uncultured Clostridium sp.]
MKYRVLGKTGFNISEVSLGTWQLGSKWGEEFNEKVAMETLEAAYKEGINFFDTADIYQGGLSERAIGKFIKDKKDKVFVVTKCGRKLNPHNFEGYNEENIREFIDASLENMEVDSLDLVLLHCPPSEVYENGELFEVLDRIKAEGKIKNYGVSVEKVSEAIKALDYNISAVEIIFNMFRLKPSKEFFKLAKEKNVGIIVRVPLASGLLTGKYTVDKEFGKEDHRNYNRNGDFFDKGETFSGVDYAMGIKAAQELRERLKTEELANAALKYILMYDAVSTVIPGASKAEQITRNVKASDVIDFTIEEMNIVEDVYNKYIKESVHKLW